MPTESLLKTKKYFLFWIASLLSNIGTWMQQVAQPWVMLTISNSSFLVGLDSLAMNAPLLTMANNTANSNLQLKATNQVRGKFASLFQLAFRGGLSMGALLTGMLTSQVGIANALMVNGCLAFLIHFFLLRRNGLRKSI